MYKQGVHMSTIVETAPNPAILSTLELSSVEWLQLKKVCWLEFFDCQRPYVVIEINQGNHLYINTRNYYFCEQNQSGQYVELNTRGIATNQDPLFHRHFLTDLDVAVMRLGRIIGRSNGYENSKGMARYANAVGTKIKWKAAPGHTLTMLTFFNPNSAVQTFFSTNYVV
jgi:hypothetical protein